MIQIKSVWKAYIKNSNKSCVLKNIDLDIRPGEIISIIGPSGCGKTTLLKLIAGLIELTSGEIVLDHNKLSIVFQDPVLLKWRTVKENIKLPFELNKIKNDKKVKDIIKLVKLKGFENHFPNELSGGMQQRVNLARALVTNPDLLLMDEPFGALDEITRNDLNLELLRIWLKLKTTIILVTHSINEAVFLSDKVVILSKSPAEIKKIIDITLTRPRDIAIKETKEFQRYVKCIRENLD